MIQTATDQPASHSTIWSVYQPIEVYRDLLPAAEEPAYDPAARLQPLDAYLIHLVLGLLPGRPTLVDLAADATWGTTTVLGLTHPRVRKVLIPEPGTAHDYRFILERYRAESAPAPALEPLPALPGTPAWAAAWGRVGKGRDHVFLLPAHAEPDGPVTDRVRACLTADPDGLILILGLGPVGQCGAVQGLLGACGEESGRRFWLLRELGDCLLSSQVGLVARREHGSAAEVMQRLRQMYTTNFSFLNLVKKACLAAIQTADVDGAALKAHHTGWLVENREVVAKLEASVKEARDEAANLKQALAEVQQAQRDTQQRAQKELQQTRGEIARLREEAQRGWRMHGRACAEMASMRQALWEKDQLLASIRAGLTYRLAQRVHRTRQWLIPDDSRRFRLYRKVRRAAGIWRAEGLGRLVTRVARKCWPR